MHILKFKIHINPVFNYGNAFIFETFVSHDTTAASVISTIILLT